MNVPLESLRTHLVTTSELWQYQPLSQNEIGRFAHDKGIIHLWDYDIVDIWRLGLLRADLIVSPKKLFFQGIVLCNQDDNGQYNYLDLRHPPFNHEGLANTLSNSTRSRSIQHIKFYFHPFRFYMLYHLERIFSFKTHPLQFFWTTDGVFRVIKICIEGVQEWSKKKESLQRYQEWNYITELAIVLEPVSYQKVYKSFRFHYPDSEETFLTKLQNYQLKVDPILQQIGLKIIEKYRLELCRDSEILDPNYNIHPLLRLMNKTSRERLKGTIGGTTLLIDMAEIIRRASERIFQKQLPEEDECGFGQWRKGAKKKLYGTNRVFDAPRNIINELIRRHGLDYGVRVRCYVEGETEYGALDHAIAERSGIEIINLKGQVKEKGQKGLAFADSLQQDKKSRIFSFILIDADNEVYVRSLKSTAQKNNMCGEFYFSDPDFERQNFTADELSHIIWNMAIEYQEDVINNTLRDEFTEIVKNAYNNKQDILHEARKFLGIQCIKKGVEWGRKLVEYTFQNPKITRNDVEPKERLILSIIKSLIRGLRADYTYCSEEMRVDPGTGKLVKRS